jgi:hypothetical protein
MPRRPMTIDQRRTLFILLVIAAVIAILAIGIGWLALSIGAPLWLALVLAIVITAVVGLFMFLQLV